MGGWRDETKRRLCAKVEVHLDQEGIVSIRMNLKLVDSISSLGKRTDEETEGKDSLGSINAQGKEPPEESKV